MLIPSSLKGETKMRLLPNFSWQFSQQTSGALFRCFRNQSHSRNTKLISRNLTCGLRLLGAIPLFLSFTTLIEVADVALKL